MSEKKSKRRNQRKGSTSLSKRSRSNADDEDSVHFLHREEIQEVIIKATTHHRQYSSSQFHLFSQHTVYSYYPVKHCQRHKQPSLWVYWENLGISNSSLKRAPHSSVKKVATRSYRLYFIYYNLSRQINSNQLCSAIIAVLCTLFSENFNCIVCFWRGISENLKKLPLPAD